MFPRLPSGTVTFLFTDIEGSTRLWEEHPEAMQVAVAHHDSLLGAAIEVHGGTVFKTVGDGFCAVFPTAAGALRAAAEAQKALAGEVRQETGPLRVRMALHSGSAEERDGDYFGPPVNRVARMLAAGHGGQVLLSQTSSDLARDHLPEQASLRDLGEHRLKDLARPERLYQLVLPGLPDVFPALRTIEARPHNLPLQASPLIGRESEVTSAARMLRQNSVRLLTLTGPGGAGKTRLALEVAKDLLDGFEHGVYFVPLVSVLDPDQVPAAIARVLAIREEGQRPMLEVLKEQLCRKQLLLVLDNFEQVVEAAPLAAELLADVPELKLLVTSRIGLHLRGEKEFAVPPLAHPEPGRVVAAEEAARYPAVRLFLERARDANPAMRVTDENAAIVVAICARLDGLPLALELAATRLKLLAPGTLLSRLDSRLRVLTGGARDLPARQQTLRGAIAWSYDLLQPPEQMLFRRLAVFSGGFTLEAAAAVCEAGDPEWEILDSLTLLVESSLLSLDVRADDARRFRMLETIREYALERLEESGEAAGLRRRHHEYYCRWIEAGSQQSQGQEEGAWWKSLESEHENIRAALDWSLAQPDCAAENLELVIRLVGFWHNRGYLREGRGYLEAVLAVADDSLRWGGVCAAVHGAGLIAWTQGDFSAARSYLERNLASCRLKPDHPKARWGMAITLRNLGSLCRDLGDFASAREYCEEALEIAHELDDKPSIGAGLFHLAELSRQMGDFAGARSLFLRSSDVMRDLGETQHVPGTMASLGQVALGLGELEEARGLLRDSLRLNRDSGSRLGCAECLEGLAWLAELEEQPARAARLLGVAASIRQSAGSPLLPSRKGEHDRRLERIRSVLGEQAFTAAWEQGRSLTLDQAIVEVLGEERGPSGVPA